MFLIITAAVIKNGDIMP